MSQYNLNHYKNLPAKQQHKLFWQLKNDRKNFKKGSFDYQKITNLLAQIRSETGCTIKIDGKGRWFTKQGFKRLVAGIMIAGTFATYGTAQAVSKISDNYQNRINTEQQNYDQQQQLKAVWINQNGTPDNAQKINEMQNWINLQIINDSEPIKEESKKTRR